MTVSADLWKVPIRSEAELLQMRVKALFGSIDGLDADAVATFFAAGAKVRLPGIAAIVGQAVIRKALVQFSLGVDDLHHELVQVWGAGNLSVFEADMTLRLADRPALSLPVTYIIRWVDNLIQEASIHVYLEARLAVAMSGFDRLRTAAAGARKSA